MSNQSTISPDEARQKFKEDSQYIRITNSTSEKILVYGPERATDGGRYATSWYVLHPGETTPGWWECGGFFVPNDRRFSQGSEVLVKGPIAVKYNKLKSVSITKEGDKYVENGDPNDGIFHRAEIDWSIPEFSARDCQEISLPKFEIPTE